MPTSSSATTSAEKKKSQQPGRKVGPSTSQKPADSGTDTDKEEPKETPTSFAALGLSPVLVEACAKLKWTVPTPIQAQVIPLALEDDSSDAATADVSGRRQDVIGLAETGSGKTGAFCLPLLQQLLQGVVKQALILTPTRELAFQIQTVVAALGAPMGVTSVCIVGGVDRTRQAIALGRNPHVIVATPGRLLDHLRDTKGFHLRRVRYLVLDEGDRMLSLDFEEELHQILDNMENPTSATGDIPRQTLLFSATMTSQVSKLQRASLRADQTVKVQVSARPFQTPEQLIQSYLFIPAKYKDVYLTWLVQEWAGKSILVFAATCNNVQRLTLMLRNLGFGAVGLHGQLNQAARLGALQKFVSQTSNSNPSASSHRSSANILICTDIASRGLDMPHVDVVIQYDLPGHGKEYIHRVGRTARAGRSGQAIAMVTQYDVEVFQRIEALLMGDSQDESKKLPAYPTAPEEVVLVLLERVSEAQRMATRELKEQSFQKSNGSGRRKRRRLPGEGLEEEGLESMLQQELKKGYAGGSGGHGGSLHNQRGNRNRKKKKYGRR